MRYPFVPGQIFPYNRGLNVSFLLLIFFSFFQDLYSTGKGHPPLDSKQDFTFINASEINGKTTLEFSRKRQTGDAKDHQFEVETHKSYIRDERFDI